jgi:hypothetical protein
LILAFKLMPLRCRRRGRPCKFGGPPLFALSLKVQRDSTHDPNSEFAVLPRCYRLNARRLLKVL